MTSDTSRLRRLLPIAALAVALAAASCASGPGPEVARRTEAATDAQATTVTYGTLVFARERPELAAHARDYLTLVPIAVGPAGSQSLYFYGYVWSTIDKRGLRSSDDDAGQFELIANDRRIPLAPVQATPDELGLAVPPLRAPSGSARLLIAATSRETLEFLAAAANVRAVLVHGDKTARYELWSGSPDSLLAMR